MAPSELRRMLFTVCFLVLGVSTQALYFNGGDETKAGLDGLAEFIPNGEVDGDKTVMVDGDKDGDFLGWKDPQLQADLTALKNSLKSKYSSAAASKRAWLPGTQTGLFGKRGGQWMSPEKRQLWANQQSGLFGKREEGRGQAPPRWTVKRSAEESEFDQKREGGVPHIFRAGGIFGKRSAEDW